MLSPVQKKNYSLQNFVKALATPQVYSLFNHLYHEGSISGVEAYTIHKIRALPRRIKDLEELGVKIKRSWKRDVTGQRYVRYTLV